MIRAVLLDLDGTLMDTAGEIDAALARTFAELGVAPLLRPNVEALIGRGVRSLLERALAHQHASGIDVDSAVERFERHYAEVVGTSATLFPGVMPGLRLLHGSGRALAVITNKPRLFTQRLLFLAAIDSMMGIVIAGDDGIRRKPAGDMLVAACGRMGTSPAETLMLGDSENDVVAARAAGCPVGGVPYGYNEGRGPETLACDRLVGTVEEAARIIVASP
jgi:phosphoglycolate phosphatase